MQGGQYRTAARRSPSVESSSGTAAGSSAFAGDIASHFAGGIGDQPFASSFANALPAAVGDLLWYVMEMFGSAEVPAVEEAPKRRIRRASSIPVTLSGTLVAAPAPEKDASTSAVKANVPWMPHQDIQGPAAQGNFWSEAGNIRNEVRAPWELPPGPRTVRQEFESLLSNPENLSERRPVLQRYLTSEGGQSGRKSSRSPERTSKVVDNSPSVQRADDELVSARKAAPTRRSPRPPGPADSDVQRPPPAPWEPPPPGPLPQSSPEPKGEAPACAKGKPPAPPVGPKAKAKAKAPGPPPPQKVEEKPQEDLESGCSKKDDSLAAPSPAPAAKGRGKGKAPVVRREKRLAFNTPFGKRLHWVKPQYEDSAQGTIFSEEASGGQEFDVSLLNAMMGSSTSQSSRPCKWLPKAEHGVCLLSSARAQNIAITFGKLGISPTDLATLLIDLDFAQQRLKPEDCELLLGKLPTPEETKLLLKNASRIDELRDIERQVMPLCSVPAAETRLKLIYIALTHATEYEGLQKRLECTWQASSEVISSMRLRELLRAVLRIANYINHGSSDGAKSFSVKSLPAFASFTAGNVSTMHYLCLSLCDPEFVALLRQELAHVPEASRESSLAQQQDVNTFAQFVAYTETQLAATAGDEGATGRLQALHATLAEQSKTLQRTLERVRMHVEDVQRFFGDPGSALLPGEEFFGYITNFVNLLASTSQQVQQNPKRWQRFVGSGEMMPQARGPRLKRSLSTPPPCG